MGLFKSGTKAKFRPIPLSESQKAADAVQQRLVEQDINLPLQETAGLSQLEQLGLNRAGEIGQVGVGGLAQGAVDVLEKTLAGDFDPRTSPFFQGFRQEAERLKGKAISDVQRRSQRLTGAPAGTALRQTGEVGALADESILQTLGGLFENERSRQFAAAPQALNAASGISNFLMQAGGLPRSIEQNILNAQFAQSQGNILAPFQLQAPLAENIMNQQRFTFTPGTQGSSLFQDIAGIAGIAGNIASLGMGGMGGLGGGTGGGLGIGAGGAGGLFGGIQSFLSGGGQLGAGSTTLFDLNSGNPSIPAGGGLPFSSFS